MFTSNFLSEVIKYWGLALTNVCSGIDVAGSPERSDFRTVIEDNNFILYVLEKIPNKIISHKQDISKTLEFLYKKGLKKIIPYKCSLENNSIVEYKNSYWQLVPYIEGEKLPQPEYVFNRWRGSVLADFLIDFRKSSEDIPFFDKSNIFSLPDYIYNLISAIKNNKPEILNRMSDVVSFLEQDFMTKYKDFSVSFCHGDYHPVNVIWGEKTIKAVIDWEFLGYKPEIYDIANLIGCVGIEDPSALVGGLVEELIRKIKDSEIISGLSWDYLLEFIIALRFAWLSEWLRKKDEEMQEMEIDYMHLLIERREFIKQYWDAINSETVVV